MARKRYWTTPWGRQLSSEEMSEFADFVIHKEPINQWLSQLVKNGKMSREQALEVVNFLAHEALFEVQSQLEAAQFGQMDLPEGPIVATSEECH